LTWQAIRGADETVGENRDAMVHDPQFIPIFG
jgi:hypothetical protein